MEPRRRAEHWASFRLHLVGRAITCLAILTIIGVVGLTVGFVRDTWPIAALMIFALLLSAPYYYLGKKYPDRLQSISLGVILGEVGLLAIGEYLLGGRNAVYGLPLYGILIVMAATLHSSRAAYAVALFGTASYAVVVFSPRVGWLPLNTGPAVLSMAGVWPLTSTLVNLFFGLAIAVVASSLWSVKEKALTQLEHAEERLRELNRQLERRVEEAVAAVNATNQSLIDRNNQLFSTLRQMNLIASAISHDLRNPVTAASEALRLFEESSLPNRETLLDLARKSLARVDQMVVGLRNLMREVGSPSNAERLPVRPLVDRVCDEIAVERMQRRVRINIVGSFGEIEANREQLEHVFRNLLANAIEHNEGRPDLLVEIGQDQNGDLCSFFVRDNGKGIPEALQTRVFEPFQRGADAKEGGLGLGLALAAAIVSRAGGELCIESTENEGATFRFTWPAKRSTTRNWSDAGAA